MNPSRLALFSSVALGLALLSCNDQGKSDGAVPLLTKEQALRVLDSPDSSPIGFETALKQIATNAQPLSYWLRLASDTKYRPDDRRRCAKIVFDHYITGGMTGGDLLTKLGVPVNWLSEERAQRWVEVLGWLPITTTNAISKFGIPVLAEDPGNYRLGVFVAFFEDVSLDAFKAALRSGSATSSVKLARIEAVATYDSRDDATRLPGNPTNHWLWHFAGPRQRK